MAKPPPIDLDLLAFFNRPGTPWLDGVMETASHRGVLLALAVVAAIYLWRKSPHGILAMVLFSVAIGAADLVSVRLVKPEAARVRPCAWDPKRVQQRFTGLAFPSGHAAQATAVWGMLAALVAAAATRWSTKVAAWSAAVFIAAVVGISRVYLGAHWPTDVLAGWALGAAVGAGLVLLARLRHTLVPR